MDFLNGISVAQSINLKPQAGDKASPVNGDLWYNSTLGKFRKMQNGSISDAFPAVGSTYLGTISVSFSPANYEKQVQVNDSNIVNWNSNIELTHQFPFSNNPHTTENTPGFDIIDLRILQVGIGYFTFIIQNGELLNGRKQLLQGIFHLKYRINN